MGNKQEGQKKPLIGVNNEKELEELFKRFDTNKNDGLDKGEFLDFTKFILKNKKEFHLENIEHAKYDWQKKH